MTTLLTVVQDVLEDISGDEVNSIDDTNESSRVAGIVQGKYMAMMSNRNWPHQKQTLTLTPSGDSNFPTHMSIADDIKEVILINYDVAPSTATNKQYREIKWKEPDDFLRYTNQRSNSNTNVLIVTDVSGVELMILNSQAPTYYTSFNDEDLIFDSFDNTVESTLQGSKTQAMGYVMTTFSKTDDYVIDIPMEAEAALLEQCKSTAQWKLRQIQDPDSGTEARRQQRWLSRKSWRVNGGIRYTDFGRKR